jgi:hypothetical protein
MNFYILDVLKGDNQSVFRKSTGIVTELVATLK